MPFADIRDVRARGVAVVGRAPVTEMSYRTVREHVETRPVDSRYGEPPREESSNPFGLNSYEIEVLSSLPRPLLEFLSDEAEDPAFISNYLIPALHSHDPFMKITNDIASEIYDFEEEARHGDFGLGKKKKKGGFFKKAIRKQRKIHNKMRPKFMKKIHKKVSKGAKKVWRQYGGIIISVAGAVLAPFTGGASLAAAAVLGAAHTMYYKKKAAVEAKKAAKVEAGQIRAEADKQEAETAAQVDKFYKDNEGWFLQYDITPTKWGKLTLDQKIKLIEAGAKGELPPGTKEVSIPSGQQVAEAQATARAAQAAHIPQAAVAPPGAPPGQGYSTSDGGAPPPQEAAQQAAQEGTAKQYTAVVEGQVIGTFGSADEAYQAILNNSQPGNRFEILVDGQTMGLAVRTTEGAVEVPPEAEQKVKEMTPEQSQAVVAQAEAQPEKKGGFPWWLILAGGAAVIAAKG